MLQQTCVVTVTQSAFGVIVPWSCKKLIKGLGLNKHRINLSVSQSGTEFFSLDVWQFRDIKAYAGFLTLNTIFMYFPPKEHFVFNVFYLVTHIICK